MNIGIIGAMEIEIIMLKERLENVTTETISSITYYKGELCGNNIILARCGVGKVNAAVCTQTMILKYNPDVVINIGVAGGVDSRIKINDLIIADHVVQHDMDTSHVGDAAGFITGIDLIEIPCSKKYVEIFNRVAHKMTDTNIYVGTVASGDQFIFKSSEKERILKSFGALCTEMEGGSIGHVCYMNGVEFCVIRAISDTADDNSDNDFNTFAELAAQTSTNMLVYFIEHVK